MRLTPIALLALLAGYASSHANAQQAGASGRPATPNCPSCATWNAPQAPFRLFGNSYYVGTHGLSAILVTSPHGHVLIDGALPESAPLIAANIRALGFRVEDVKVILNSHVHFDHAGGLAELQRLSGADVYASARSVGVLRSGEVGHDDPQYGILTPIAPVARVREIPAGDSVQLGTLVLHALRTPGHTPGGTSWSWTACEGSECRAMVYGDSQSAISADGFLYTKSAEYPTALADFAAGFAALESVACDILVTPHPEATGLWERLMRREGGAGDAMREVGGCKRYAAGARERLAKRVEQERVGGK